MWNDDPIFKPGGALHGQANPVFRVTGYFPYVQAHPYRMPDRWQALLDCFLPLVREHCDKVLMWDRPGAKARRAKQIKDSDWRPFHHLLTIETDIDSGIFTGFHFIDRRDELDGNGRGPCSIGFFVGSAIRFDAAIPLDDWNQGRLDIEAIIEAFQALPYVSLMGGFGLSLGSAIRTAHQDVSTALMDYVARYPLVDVALDEDRSFFPGSPEDFPALGISGINWLTAVGEPFRTRLGGTSAIASGAPTGVQVKDGPFGTMLILGDAPCSGESPIADATAPLCHWLGKRLKPAYYPSQDDPRAPVFGRSFAAESLAWERRFYGGEGLVRSVRR